MQSSRLIPQLHRTIQSLARTASSSASPTVVPSAKPSLPAKQAPNYPSTWSTSQQPRPEAGSGPRFEQTIMELQPSPLSAMELIANESVKMVHGRKAVCDGGPYCYLFLIQLPPKSNGILSRRRASWPSKNIHQLGSYFLSLLYLHPPNVSLHRINQDLAPAGKSTITI